MLTIKNIAATLAVLGSGAMLVACGGSQTKANEVPATQTEATEASCGGKGEAGCGGKKEAEPEKEASCGAAAGGTEAACGGKGEAGCGAKTESPAPAEADAGAAPATTAAAAAPPPPPVKAPPRKHKPKGPAEAACGEGTCA